MNQSNLLIDIYSAGPGHCVCDALLLLLPVCCDTCCATANRNHFPPPLQLSSPNRRGAIFIAIRTSEEKEKKINFNLKIGASLLFFYQRHERAERRWHPAITNDPLAVGYSLFISIKRLKLKQSDRNATGVYPRRREGPCTNVNFKNAFSRRLRIGEKPHVCDVCGIGFSTSSSLNTHRRIHSGEKPHQCPVCGKRFTASSNLYYHRMTHIKVNQIRLLKNKKTMTVHSNSGSSIAPA